VIGSGTSTLSTAELRAAVAATVSAAVIFGPVRQLVQRFIDERLGRNRVRARRLLREASEAAITTLDVAALQTGVVHRVKAALGARGAAIYIAGPDGTWRREAWAGHSPLPRGVDGEASRRLDLCVASGAPRELEDNRIVCVPLPIDGDLPAALVVEPHPGTRFDEEERDLLHAAAAGLVIAIGNARAHTALQTKSEELRRQVEVAEERRREIARLKERVEEENRVLIGELASRRGKAPVIGAGLKPTFELVQKVAKTRASVLVRGETGVGKELVARAIHAASGRRDKPFIVVDCGAMSPALFESTLFGHIRGAFTGAVRDSQGAFRAADGGTIFLDEIGELPTELQPKLLRVLQEREVHPVGVAEPVAVDVRVIAGTNRDLVDEVEDGNFREDLLYRLQVVEINVPSLRQRRGDVEALAEHFLAVAAERANRPQKRLAPDAMQALCDHDWPGNVRELEHTIEAAAVYAEGDEIRASDLPIFDKVFRKKGRRAISESGVKSEGGAPRSGLRETLEGLEKTRLIEALVENRGNKSATARALGMSRGALLRRLKRYDIEE
jgi:transcriptional regulator with GAF, ATPase, and Fis domain